MAIKMPNLKTVKISENFIDRVHYIIEMRAQSEWHGDALVKSLIQMKSPAGTDRMITSLKRLPYQSFSVAKNGLSDVFLIGKTDDIVLDIHGARYNIGPYFVGIPEQCVFSKEINPVHFFPAYDPLTTHRHLHHYASQVNTKNPLNARPHTCWASIGSSYLSAIRDVDIVDMFRILYIYIIRLDWNSPYDRYWENEAIYHGEKVE